jgi:hypothetical protein
MIARDDLHTILDSIPEDRLDAAREALAALADPVLLALLSAPEDDEPLTEEDLQAIAEGHAEMERGELVPLDDLIAREAAET